MAYFVHMAEHGFPLTHTMTKAFAWAIAKRSGKDDRFNPETGPGEHWSVNFRKRYQNLTLGKADKLEHSRAKPLNPEVIKEYFDLLKAMLDWKGLTNCLHQL